MTLLKHASSTRHHWHDEARNEHGCTQEHLARWLGRSVLTIWRHLHRGQEVGFLQLHRNARNGQQALYHYVLPGEVSECESCEPKWQRGRGRSQRDPSCDLPPAARPMSATDPSPLEVPRDTGSTRTDRRMPRRTEVARSASTNPPQPGNHAVHVPSSPPCQPSSPVRSAAASPASDLTSDTVAGLAVTTRREFTPPCLICDLPLNGTLFALEPWYLTHPSCDLQGLDPYWPGSFGPSPLNTGGPT